MSEEFDEINREICQDVIAANDDLKVDVQAFISHVRAITNRYFGSRDTVTISPVEFVRSLHLNDLLLAFACSCGYNAAWQRFGELYRAYLSGMSRRLTNRSSDSGELGDVIWIDLFLPDRSGQSRIASYDGRSSLATWLRVVVSNRIVNEHLRKDSRLGTLDRIPEAADPAALRDVETKLGLSRYSSMIVDAFRRASSTLNPQDRLVLLLRYDQELSLGEIARLQSVHQSTVTRRMERTVRQLRDGMVSVLISEYGLEQDAVAECLSLAAEAISRSVPVIEFLRRLPAVDCPSGGTGSLSMRNIA